MIGDQKIQEFLEALSSGQPVPGGGGASALAGALGNSLGRMVGNLTSGKKRYAEFQEELEVLMKRLDGLQEDFLMLARKDEEVFEPLAQCYRLPAATEEEKAYKASVMEERLLAASLVPLELMEKALELMEILEVLAKNGSRMAVSDVGVGVQMARAALLGAVMNVYINTKSMSDRTKAEELNSLAGKMADSGIEKADRIYASVITALTE